MGNAPNRNSAKIDSVHLNDATQFILVLLQNLLCELTFMGPTAKHNCHMLPRYSFLLGSIEKDRSYVETEYYKKFRITTRNTLYLLQSKLDIKLYHTLYYSFQFCRICKTLSKELH